MDSDSDESDLDESKSATSSEEEVMPPGSEKAARKGGLFTLGHVRFGEELNRKISGQPSKQHSKYTKGVAKTKHG